MRDIYGYVSSSDAGSSEDHALLEKMYSSLGYTHDACLNSVSTGQHDCGLGCHKRAATLHSEENLLVSLAGRAWWSETGLQSLAEKRSHAHAAAEAYNSKGAGLLQHLHGSFSLAIIEPQTGNALIAVDRMGTMPLAYGVRDTRLVFASRADAVVSYPGFEANINPQQIFNYLYFHMVPSPACIYEGISKLLPGEYLTYNNGNICRDFYWQIDYRESGASEKSLSSDLLSLLEKSVNNCLSGQPTGAFLSGGLDSSTITGMMAKISDRNVNAYGIGFDASGYDEMEYARASARHFGAHLHEYYVTPRDVIDAIPKIAAAYDEPFGNASAIPAYYCARLAKRDGMSCLLAGDGGDEIFAGNERYARQLLLGMYNHIPAVLRDRVMEPVFLEFDFIKRIPLAGKIASYIEQARQRMPDRMEAYNFLHRYPLDDLLDQGFMDRIDQDTPRDILREVYGRARTDSILKRMLHMDLKITLADNDLRKVGRMCDLAGIEVRYPLLEDELVAFSATIPANRLIRRMELRSFYRRAVRDFLAPETLDKNKHGFGLPFGIWMKEHASLRDLAHDSLANFGKRGYLSQPYIDNLVREHQHGHAGYYGVMIWVIMMLEQWLSAHNL
jgi:asparagine synthase (glutamine-hydrolysing)